MSLNSEPMAAESTEICDEASEEYLRETLTAALEESDGEGILALDFEDIRLFKVTAVRRTLGWLAQKTSATVCLVGLSPEIAFHITSESTVPEAIAKRETTWLLIQKTGAVAWFGLSVETDLRVLGLVLEGGTVDAAGINSATREAVIQSSALFSIDPVGLVRRSSDCEMLLVKMERAIERRIAAELEALEIRTDGHYKLPSGLHTNRVFQTSLLLNRGPFVTRLAMEMARRIRRYRADALVSNSLFAYALANEVAAFLEPRPIVIESYGYPEPRISLAAQACEDLRVVIVTDIVSSGTSITSLRSQLDRLGMKIPRVITAININGAADRVDAEALVSFDDSQHTRPSCPQCKQGLAYQEIDPFTSMAVSHQTSQADLNPILGSEDFWQIVLENDALREGHFSFNGHHFSVFIETPRILKNPASSRRIVHALLQDYAKRGVLFDCIVFPVHPGGVAFATSIWNALKAASERAAPLLIPATKSSEGGHTVSRTFGRYLRGKSVLIVDDGVNFGDTLSGVYFAVAEFKPAAVECTVFVDRLSPFHRRRLIAVLEGHKLISVYHLSIPAVHVIRCPICRERRELLRLLRSSVGQEIRQSARRKLAELEIQSIDPEVQEVEGEVRVAYDPIPAE